jgi:hypothetical protein
MIFKGALESVCRSRGCCWNAVSQPGVPWCFHRRSSSACSVSDKARSDCHPEAGASKDNCVSRGCCYQSSTAKGASWCFYPTGYRGYTVENIKETNVGKSASLQKASSTVTSTIPNVLNKLTMDVEEETDSRIHVKVMLGSLFNLIIFHRNELSNKITHMYKDKEVNNNVKDIFCQCVM